ncbi:MAG: lysophospholipid acyltransferase family protein [Oscillospiraceae bacterium]
MKRKSGAYVKKPNRFLYWLAIKAVYPFLRTKYNVKIDKSELDGIKAPVLVLSNHQSNIDFLIAAIALYPIKLNFLVTTYFFHQSQLKWMLDTMGCIPKKQFIPDVHSIKQMLAVCERGDSIGIFPEGQVCYTGETCDIDASIGKLVKKLGLTTVTVSIRGNHLTMPKWGAGITEIGKVEAKACVMMTSDEILESSVEEINKKIHGALEYNEYEWQRKTMAECKKGRTAQRLETILHRCPFCGTDFAMQSDKNILFCEKCGYSVRRNSYGFFEKNCDRDVVFDNPVDWYHMQRDEIEREIDGGKLPFVSKCNVYHTVEGHHGYTLCGEGVMSLDKNGLHMVGDENGRPIESITLLERQSNLAHNAPLCAVDIHGEGENYAFEPDDGRKMIKFVEMYACLHKRNKAEKDQRRH